MYNESANHLMLFQLASKCCDVEFNSQLVVHRLVALKTGHWWLLIIIDQVIQKGSHQTYQSKQTTRSFHIFFTPSVLTPFCVKAAVYKVFSIPLKSTLFLCDISIHLAMLSIWKELC